MTVRDHSPTWTGAQTTSSAARERNTWWVAMLLFVVALLSGAYDIYLAVQLHTWQMWVVAGVALVLAVTSLVSARMARRGKSDWGAVLEIGGVVAIVLASAGLVAGIGLLLGLLVLVAALVMATLTLPPRWVNWAMMVGVVAAFLAGLADLLAPPVQQTIPAMEAFLPVVSGVTLVIFAVIVIRQFQSYTLASKLTIVFLTLAVVALGAVALLTEYATRAALTNSATQTLSTAAAQTAGRIDTFVRDNLTAISADAQLPALNRYLSLPAGRRTGSPEEAEVTWILNTLTRKDQVYITSYALLDREGRDVVDTYRSDIAKNKSDRDYFQAVLKTGQPHATAVQFYRSSGESSLYFSAPVRDPDTQAIIGVLRVCYNAGILQKLVQETTGLAGAKSFAVLLDENRVYLAHGMTPDFIFQAATPLGPARVSELQAARRLPNRPSAASSVGLFDFERGLARAAIQPSFVAEAYGEGKGLEQVVVRALETQPWQVAYAQPQAVFLAPAEVQTRIALLLALVVAGVVAGTAIGMSQMLAGPVNRLTDVARQVTEGDLSAQARVEAADEIGALAAAFNSMTAQLRDLIDSLEQRVAERTRDADRSARQAERRAAQVSTAAEVSRAASQLLDPGDLLHRMVELIRERFDFYYVAVFLVDEPGRDAVLRAATGEAGRTLLARGHKLGVGGNSMVGWTCANRQARIALDVETEAIRAANPLLPDTRSEMALPLHVGERVIGALDIQSVQLRAFDEEDITALQGMTDQIAVALETARLFSQTQATLAETAALYTATRAISTAGDDASVFKAVVDHVLEPDVDLCLVALFDPYEGDLPQALEINQVWARAGNPDMTAGARYDFSRFPLHDLFRADQAWVAHSDVEATLSLAGQRMWNRLGMQVMAFAPLKAGARWIGVLGLGKANEPEFDAAEMRTYEAIAGQAAIAIENRRLMASTQASLRQLSALTRSYTHEAWSQMLQAKPALSEYEYARTGGAAGDGVVLNIPLAVRGQEIGMAELASSGRPSWSEQERLLAETVVAQTALALDSARLFEQTQMSLADIRALYEASAQINSATTLDEILAALRQHTELGQADLIVAFNLFDTPWVGDRMPEATEVAMRWTTLPVESLSTRDSLAGFPAARLLRPDEPFVMTDIERDARLDDAARQLYRGTFQGRSALLVPLVVAGQWIGFVNAVWSQCREFAESDLRRIMLLSGQAATAVQTRRLFEQTQARVQQLAALNEISRAASGLLDTDKLLTAIREQIQRIVRMDTFFVGVYDFQTHVMTYPICYDDGQLYHVPPEQLSPDARSYSVITSGDPLLVEYSPEDRQRIQVAPSNMMGDEGRVSASLIYVPLRIGDRVVGVMSVQSYEPHVYTQEHVELMSAIANQVAVALENARLFEQARHRALQLATASEAGRAATSILDMNELLQSVVELVCTRFGYDHASVFLLDETGQFAILREATGTASQQLKQGGYQFAVGGQSLVGWVTSKGRSRVVTDVNEDARYLKADLWPQSRSELCIPLKRGERVVGAVDVHSSNLAAFSQDDVAVLEMLADQLAIAIQNARLYGQTREQSVILEKRAADLAVLNEASRLMAQTFDPAEILDSAAHVMVRHFGVGHAGILLLNESRTILRVAAEYPERGTVGAEVLAADSPALMEYMASRRAAAMDDVITDPRMESLRLSFLQLSVRSAVFLPLMVKSDLVGYIRLDAIGMLRRFTDEEVSLGQTLASQVAVALQNAWLYQAEQRRAARQSALYQVGRRMTATLDPSDLMNTVVESVQLDLGFERVLVLLTDAATAEVYAAAASTNFADLIPPDYRQRIGQGMIGLAAQRGQTQLANDTRANTNYYPVGAWNPRSELCVPLKVGARVIGVLDVENDAPGAFGEEDVRTLESLAGQLAVALENARLYEEQRQTTEKLREVDRLKTEFLANMSHELRTPLNSIIGFSRVILKGIDGPLTDLQKQDLEAIHGSGQQLLGLINDILDISKIEAGKMELAFQEVNLHDIIKGVMSSAVGLVKGKPVELRREVPDDLPTVWADVTRARQVLLNLVSNAAKFTDKGAITVFAGYDDLFVTIGVRDTGIGIPADKLDKIFEEFTQVDPSTTRQYGGTGLGLAITRRFVQMHGGQVWAESELNQGSTFYFSLPRTQPVAMEADAIQVAEPRKRLLLAVDDDLGVITLYKRYLEKLGYQVIGVTDSRQVVEQARRLRPDVITLDILMPNKDGWSVIQELRRTVDTRHIPVVVCSIISDQGKGFSLGAADYLVKPITEDELVMALKRLDGRHQVTVLIIDDTLEDVRLIRRILEAPRGEGDSQPLYAVQEAHTGAEGIAAVRQGLPNLIILDLMMPEVDGLTVLEAIKADPATRGIPIIVVTAKELTDQDHERLNGNIGALLSKGLFSEQDLLNDVEAALHGAVQASTVAKS